MMTGETMTETGMMTGSAETVMETDMMTAETVTTGVKPILNRDPMSESW